MGLCLTRFRSQYPVITAHHASRSDVLNKDPRMVTASTNRHLIQPTRDNRARRKSRIESIQHSADKGKHRARSPAPNGDATHTQSLVKARLKPLFMHAGKDHDHDGDDDSNSSSDRSQLVDLIVEDQEAEELDRVRARKEGSPEWNRSEPKRYVYVPFRPRCVCSWRTQRPQ